MMKYYFNSDSMSDSTLQESYEEWLEQIGEEDSDLLREWYELDDEDRYEWLENHPDPF